MTPQLMQAIKLLQLSSLDLAAYVEAELEKNPLLERADPAPGEESGEASGQGSSDDGAPNDDGGNESERNETIRADSDEPPAGFSDDGDTDISPRQQAADAPAYSEWANVGSGGSADSDYNLEAFVSAETTLADHLARQLSLAPMEPVQRMIGQYLINLVDEAGYLRGELETTAEKLGAPLKDIEAVLSILQSFDPPGVCARDLDRKSVV